MIFVWVCVKEAVGESRLEENRPTVRVCGFTVTEKCT